MHDTSNPIHVCILTTGHPVDDVRLRRKLAESLVRDGVQVTWVGPDYKYVEGPGAPPPLAGCSYRLFVRPQSRMARLFSRRLARTAARVERVDVYLATEPDSAPVAVALAKKFKARAVFDMHELYDRLHVQNWAPRFALPLARLAVRTLISRSCSKCDLVIGVSEGVLAPYRACARECMVVRNCAPKWFADPLPADVCSATRRTFTIMHGKSIVSNGTAIVLRALALAAARVPGLRVVMFQWVDQTSVSARANLESEVAHLGLNDVVDLRAPIQMAQVPEVLRSCDLGMIGHGRLLGAGTQPNRLYEYMASGLPILAPVYDEGIAPVIRAERCGVLADFEDPASIADAIVRLRDNPDMCREMGRRAREAFLARHNWEGEVAPLLETLRNWFPDRRRA